MKDFLAGLLIALAAFFCGVLTTEAFRFMQEFPSEPIAVEVKIIEAPIVTIEPLEIEKESETEEVTINENYISGWYEPDSSKGMNDIRMISLYNDESGSSAGVFTTFENYGDQGFVESAWAEVDNKKAKFRTKKIKGIEYRFEGVFFKNKTWGKENEKVLRGTLQKFVKGKKVAEVSGDLAYFEPRCWH